MCKTFDFAKLFMAIYLLFLLILRLFTLVISTVISFIYHFKFRGDYLRTFTNTFIQENSIHSNTKSVRFKNVNIKYSTKYHIGKHCNQSKGRFEGNYKKNT